MEDDTSKTKKFILNMICKNCGVNETKNPEWNITWRIIKDSYLLCKFIYY